MREGTDNKNSAVVVFRIKKKTAHAVTPASATPAPSAEVTQQPAAQGTATSTPGDLKSLDVRQNCKKASFGRGVGPYVQNFMVSTD